MARKKVQRRVAGRAEEWPVEDFPYLIRRKYVQHPKYVRSHKEALAYLNGLVKDFEYEMKWFDRDIADACKAAHNAINALSEDGGLVDVVIAPYTNTRFDAELVKRIPVGVPA